MREGQTAIAAVIGGTVSEWTGVSLPMGRRVRVIVWPYAGARDPVSITLAVRSLRLDATNPTTA